MRPVLHQLALTQGIIQPFGLIVTETAEQHQIRAAGDDINGVDLQQRHTLDGGKNIGGLRAAQGLFQKPLRGKMKMTCG